MGIYLYGHSSCADHSQEDRIRGTCCLLSEPPEVVTTCPEEALRYGIAHTAGLRDTLPKLRRTDLCLTTRPDQGCGRGTTILWGWSAGAVSPKTAKALSRFHRIVVSDKQSLSALRTAGLEKTVRSGPDPSFLVQRQIRPLRGAFRQDTVGLCLSPLGLPYERWDGLLYRSYLRLIRFILEETSFHIALIPYCVRPRQDDRLLHDTLSRSFPDSPRIHCRGDGSCQALRGDLSLCRCVVGMTGAAAAWSCGVPALCLGADPRCMGLSKDLFGTWTEVVVPIGSLRTDQDLTDRFRRFLLQEDRLRRALERAVPLRQRYAAQWDIREVL